MPILGDTTVVAAELTRSTSNALRVALTGPGAPNWRVHNKEAAPQRYWDFTTSNPNRLRG